MNEACQRCGQILDDAEDRHRVAFHDEPDQLIPADVVWLCPDCWEKTRCVAHTPDTTTLGDSGTEAGDSSSETESGEPEQAIYVCDCGAEIPVPNKNLAVCTELEAHQEDCPEWEVAE